MVSTAPEIGAEEPTFKRLVLDKYEPGPFLLIDHTVESKPTTPCLWFSKSFPEQAQIHGCPFVELKINSDGLTKTNPIAPNIDFLAAILGGDKRMGHKVVFVESESQFYFFEARVNIFKPTTPEKLGNLLRALLIRCAGELPDKVHKFSLFQEFRSDKTIRAIVHRAKSILAADHTFFGVESKNAREKGPELHERIARVFAEQVLERYPGEILPLTTAYLVFCEYLKQKSMPTVKRGIFKGMFTPIIREAFDLGLRNDIHDPVTKGQTAGWKGIRALDLEDDLVKKEAA